MRLKGVGTKMANLLEASGVDSCKELQHCVPANLQAKLKGITNGKKITHYTPTLAQIEAWITEAATFAAVQNPGDTFFPTNHWGMSGKGNPS